jgi:hypothetical protein
MVITMDVKDVRLRGQHAAPLAPTMTMIGPATGTIGVLAQSSANLRDGKASSGGTGARHIWLLHTRPIVMYEFRVLREARRQNRDHLHRKPVNWTPRKTLAFEALF